MTKYDKAHRLVVVCDGAKAVVLADLGVATAPRLTVLESFAEPHPSTAALGTDRPGRVHESATVARSATEETDLHLQAEVAFLGRVAGRLGEMVSAGEAPRILLVAPPRALGTLREVLSAKVKACIDGEIAKDLVKLPVDEISRHIAT
ncbi:host attachment protein [Xanthobacter dioxanivorans]|uniref:Host attachment protein n=1 Tax=Xanthobacter dioxanivorans TaxID=2528964 RepID=A0A974PQV9_9HYPH|nr:host attachment family protein [Xanthobacter dioxanivorans]QRG08099.1 host attachment protein [Xanthobacter dioxanivorans]